MLVWENPERGKLLFASIDFDGVRIWSVKLTEVSEGRSNIPLIQIC